MSNIDHCETRKRINCHVHQLDKLTLIQVKLKWPTLIQCIIVGLVEQYLLLNYCGCKFSWNGLSTSQWEVLSKLSIKGLKQTNGPQVQPGWARLSQVAFCQNFPPLSHQWLSPSWSDIYHCLHCIPVIIGAKQKVFFCHHSSHPQHTITLKKP